MFAVRTLISPLAAAAVLCAAAAPSAAAQHAAQHAAAPRVVAVYRFAPAAVRDLPARVTLADSAGQLVASFHLQGARTARPATLAVIGDDLVLQGETPSGVLTLQLRGQSAPQSAEASRAPVTGSWTLGTSRGELRGRVRAR